MPPTKKIKSSSLDRNRFEPLLAPFLLVLLLWLFYRLFFHTSVWVEEGVIKAIIFTLPILLFPFKKLSLKRLGVTTDNFFQSVYLGLIIGLILGLSGQTGNFVRYGTINFNSFGITSATIGSFIILSLITAFWEQLLFSGYFLLKAAQIFTDELTQIVTVAFMFALIHIPALIFVQHMSLTQTLFNGILLFTLGLGTAILRLRQGNLIAPVMIHAMWGITVFLFR